MKISLKELLRFEKYLNGIGRRTNRINRFGMETAEPMEEDTPTIEIEYNNTLTRKTYNTLVTFSTKNPNVFIIVKVNDGRSFRIFSDLISAKESWVGYNLNGFLEESVSESDKAKNFADTSLKRRQEREKRENEPPRQRERKQPQSNEDKEAAKEKKEKLAEAKRKLIDKQQQINKIISDYLESLLKLQNNEFCTQWIKHSNRNKIRSESKYNEDRDKLLADQTNDALKYYNLIYQVSGSGWKNIEKILKTGNDKYSELCKIESQEVGMEDVGQSSSSQPPLSHTLSEPQPPFGPGLVGRWVYHPKNRHSPFSDYIGLIEKYETLKENGKDVANITIIWIPSSADYQNIGKKNICADIDNSENCNATTTDNCEWKEQTARSKGKCVVRDEVKCTGLNETDCNNTDTCNWNGKKCTKKILVDNIDNFLKYNYIIDDLNEEEYVTKGIQVIEKPTYEDINIIAITVDQANGIYLKLLAQLDAIKDFYGSGGDPASNIQQLNILRNYINGIIQNISKTDNELIRLLNLFTAGTEKSNDTNRKRIMDSIYTELEEKLGIESHTLEGITAILFPMDTARLKNKKEQIERFVLYHLNNETLARKLKATSNKYNGIQNNEDKNRFIDIYMNPENYMTDLDEMIVWVEGSANRNNISTLVPILSFNDIHKVSPRSFATYIDAAAKTNILTDSIGYFDVSTIGIDSPQVRYNIQTNNRQLLISFRVKRIDTQASTNNPLYVVEIDNFFGLDCTDVGPLAYIGPNISISGVWDRIKMLLFNSTEKLINNEKRNTQVDLCMKANKTLMDMLKGIITMEYKKSQAGRNTVIFSVFPDLNGARFMAANSSDGVTLHTVSSSSPRIFLKKRIFDILFDRTMDFGKKKMNEIDYLIKLVKRM